MQAVHIGQLLEKVSNARERILQVEDTVISDVVLELCEVVSAILADMVGR